MNMDTISRAAGHRPILYTPWGTADSSTSLADGIVSVSTSSHGGIHLSPQRVQQMPPALRAGAGDRITAGGDAWFEEDVDAAIVAVSFPDAFSKEAGAEAEATLRNWLPSIWEAHFGRHLEPGESHKKDEDAFYEANRQSLIVIAAFGQWASNVPPGMVGVIARIGGRGVPSSTDSSWLVPAAEYDATRGYAFIVDPRKHTRVESSFGPRVPRAA